MAFRSPLRLYCQAEANSSGIEAACLVLDEVLLARLRQSFGLLAQHQLESAAFKLPSARWLSARCEVAEVQTTAEVGCSGDDQWVRLTGVVRSVGISTDAEWAYPCAHWFLPVATDQLSDEGLSDLADSNGCLLEELDTPDIQQPGRLRANFLSVVSHDFLSTLKPLGPAVEGFVRLFSDQTLPVVGLPGDLLQLQALLDDLDDMHSHCLDLSDLADLFQGESGEWLSLRVTAIPQVDSISEAIARIQHEHPNTSAWWFLFRSLESVKRIHQATQALLPKDEGVLMIPVVSGSHGDANPQNILVITSEHLVNP